MSPEPTQRSTGRTTELLLLAGAVCVPVAGYTAAGAAADGAVPPGTAGFAAALGVPALLAHAAVRWRAPHADPLLLPIAVLLNGLGLVVIHRLDRETPTSGAAAVQLVWSAVGVALFV